MRHRASPLAAMFLALGFASIALGGKGTIRGGEEKLWTADGHNLIIARISEIAPLPPDSEDGTHSAKLEPLALLAGTLDPSAVPTLRAGFFQGIASSIRTLPPEGAIVLAVVMIDPKDKEPRALPMIVADACEFMPGRSSIAVIQGLGDPKVTETLARLQEARAKGSTVWGDKPTTRP